VLRAGVSGLDLHTSLADCDGCGGAGVGAVGGGLTGAGGAGAGGFGLITAVCGAPPGWITVPTPGWSTSSITIGCCGCGMGSPASTIVEVSARLSRAGAVSSSVIASPLSSGVRDITIQAPMMVATMMAGTTHQAPRERPLGGGGAVCVRATGWTISRCVAGGVDALGTDAAVGGLEDALAC
jgi:hypothetical protein